MAFLSEKALGTLIRVYEGSTPVNYELAGFGVHGTGNATLVRKFLRGTSAFGSTPVYSGSTIDTLCNTTIYNTFSAELKRLIKEVDIVCATGNSTSVILKRKCFLPSYTEMGFGNNYDITENAALPFFNSNARRIKTDAAGAAAVWWLRSWGSSTNARRVGTSGAATNSTPTDTRGVAPAFVLDSNTVLSDTPNEDGSFNIHYSAQINIEAKMGEFGDKPTAARAILDHNGVLTTLQLCNNYNDDAPTWENAVSGEEHEFTNGVKTAATWAVGLRVVVDRESSEGIHLYEPIVLVR